LPTKPTTKWLLEPSAKPAKLLLLEPAILRLLEPTTESTEPTELRLLESAEL
jgi:hypothetical protein